jgi:hypothetical protein
MSVFIRLVFVFALSWFCFDAVWANDCSTNLTPSMTGKMLLQEKIEEKEEVTSYPLGTELKMILPITLDQQTQNLTACIRWQQPEVLDNQKWAKISWRLIGIEGDKSIISVKLPEREYFSNKDVVKGWHWSIAEIRLIVDKKGIKATDETNNTTDEADILIDTMREIRIVPVWFASVVTFVGSIAFWWLCFFIAGCRKIPGEGWKGFVLRIIVNKYGYASLSQFQTMLWTFVVGASTVYVMVLTGRLIDIQDTMLILLGGAGAISTLTALKPTGITEQEEAGQTQQATSIPPSAVIDLQVCGKPSDTTVVLLWKPATTGSAADYYKVECKTSDSTEWATAVSATTETIVTVSGLVPEQTYDFQVSAVNSEGTASNGKIIQRVKMMATTATDDSSALEPVMINPETKIEQNSVTISWTALTSPPDNYVICYREVDTGMWLIGGIVDNQAECFRIRKLYHNTDYEFAVFAVKNGKKGKTSMVSAKTALRHPLFSDLLMAPDSKEIDVSRIQMLFFTVIAASFVVLKVFSSHALPEIPSGILTLMGISNGVYLVTKFTPKKG